LRWEKRMQKSLKKGLVRANLFSGEVSATIAIETDSRPQQGNHTLQEREAN